VWPNEYGDFPPNESATPNELVTCCAFIGAPNLDWVVLFPRKLERM